MVDAIVNALLFNPPERFSDYTFSCRQLRLVTSKNQKIAATYLKRHGATVTILYSHANSEDLDMSFPWMKQLAIELNVNVLGYDYSGYGTSTGVPSEENCYADIEAAYQYLIDERGLSPHQIVLYGRSLGSGPSCYLAVKTARQGESVGGLILHSPFASVYRVIVDFGFTMVGDKFANIDRIGDVECPVLIAHGTEDTVVGFHHGMSLHKAVPVPWRTEPFWMEGVGHNEHTHEALLELVRRFNSFLDVHVLARRLWMCASVCSSSTTTTASTTIHSNPPARAYTARQRIQIMNRYHYQRTYGKHNATRLTESVLKKQQDAMFASRPVISTTWIKAPATTTSF